VFFLIEARLLRCCLNPGIAEQRCKSQNSLSPMPV
jgi:hypothetical protein